MSDLGETQYDYRKFGDQIETVFLPEVVNDPSRRDANDFFTGTAGFCGALFSAVVVSVTLPLFQSRTTVCSVMIWSPVKVFCYVQYVFVSLST